MIFPQNTQEKGILSFFAVFAYTFKKSGQPGISTKELRKNMAAISKAVVTVIGFDRKGIIAHVSGVLYEHGINILDISQTIADGIFHMLMIVDLSEPTCSFDELQDELNRLAAELGVQIRIQKSEIFEAMHQI